MCTFPNSSDLYKCTKSDQERHLDYSVQLVGITTLPKLVTVYHLKYNVVWNTALILSKSYL